MSAPLVARALVMIMAVALSGCALKFRDVPARTLTQRSETVIERDHLQCDAVMMGKAKGAWLPAELEFAACMISRNYQAFVQVLDAPLEVRKASLATTMQPTRVLADLMACERAVQRNVTTIEKVARPAVMVAGLMFWPLGFGTSTAASALAVQRQRDYTACMTPRGYQVTLWRADPSVSPRAEEGP